MASSHPSPVIDLKVFFIRTVDLIVIKQLQGLFVGKSKTSEDLDIFTEQPTLLLSKVELRYLVLQGVK